MLTVIDTETTGIPLWREPQTDPAQPRIVQLAALHFGTDRRVVNRMTVLFERDGWVSAKAAKAAHGIPEGRSSRYGLRSKAALALLCDMVNRSSAIASFGWGLDRFMVEIEMLRAFGAFGEGWVGPNRPDLREVDIRMHAEQFASAGRSILLPDAHTAIVGSAYDRNDDAAEGAMAAARILWALVDLGQVKL